MSDRRRGPLERAIMPLRRREASGGGRDLSRVAQSTFRAVVDERLRGLERQVDELKGRVNGLIFLLAGAVAAQLVFRAVG